MENTLLNANLLKKYHSDLIYDYTEYPTKGNWKDNFTYKEYQILLSLRTCWFDSSVSSVLYEKPAISVVFFVIYSIIHNIHK